MATKVLRVTLDDILGSVGPDSGVTGEVWARYVDGNGARIIRYTDGTLVLPLPRRVPIPSGGVVDLTVVPSDDATVHVDDRGFGIEVGWSVKVRGEHGRPTTLEGSRVVQVVTADSSPVAFGLKAVMTPVIPGATYPTAGDVAATYETKTNVTAGLAGKVDKGSLVYYAADYASLSAAITAAPAGATLRLAANTTYSINNLTLTKSLHIEGHTSRSSILDAGGNAYGFAFPGSGSGNVTFQNVGFTGSTSAQVFLSGSYQHSVKFIDCRFSGMTGFAVQSAGSRVRFIRCEFDGLGLGVGTAIYLYYGVDRAQVSECTFRHLFRGIYGTDAQGPVRNLSVRDSSFDGGWMYLKTSGGTGSGGTVTYAPTTLTDTAASFAALTVNTTVRALTVKRAASFTAMSANYVTDSAANFTTASVKRGDIVRSGSVWAVVASVLTTTTLAVEEWLTTSDYQPTNPPGSTAAYTIYGVTIGRVQSNTGTVLTVDGWRDLDGSVATPAAGTLYEVAPKTDYQMFAPAVENVQIHDNVFRRAWADQISLQRCTGSVVTGNIIEDGQDVGITIEDATLGGVNGTVVANNRIRHQGTAGIFMGHQNRAVVSGNSIENVNWMQLAGSATVGYGAIEVASCSDVNVTDNNVSRLGNPSDYKAFRISGAGNRITLNGNRSTGYAAAGRPDLVIDGTGITNVNGIFQPDIGITLTGSAYCPRGSFSGTGAPAVVAASGSTYRRDDGGAGSSFYVKESSTAALNWVAK